MADEPPAEEEDLPLNNEWTVWTNMRSQAGQSKEGWESSLVQLGNFTTINKFWEYCRFIHNHFEDLRSAERGASFKVFKRRIRPMWEDPYNEGGDRAFDVLEEMDVLGVTPDTITFTSLINACSKAQQLEKAFEVIECMRAANIAPNIFT